MIRRHPFAWFAIAALLLALGGLWQWRHAHPHDAGGVPIGGGDGGGLPRAEPSGEGFDPQAFQAAVDWAAKERAGALLVLRHGHLLVERYAGDVDKESRIDGGSGLSDALLLVAAGVAVARHGLAMPAGEPIDAGSLAAAIAAASGRSYPQFLSRNVWQPLNAAPARWSAPDVSARAVDWLRVAELLLHDGRFEGTQVVPPGWVQRLHPLRTAPGAEPFADRDMYYLRGQGATRLWLAPRFELAILSVAASPASADETRLPNMIVRALRERPGVSGTSLNDLVPGH
ncbi:MAG TPA: hypothetical protein VMT49_04260 [Steroidobacteraceae bacterium]|nr:hypothetical protein [Steroidobacteraceae bacterium]